MTAIRTCSIVQLSCIALLLNISYIFYHFPHTSRPSISTMTTTYSQHHITLPSLGRGSHLVTNHITSSLPQIGGIKCGLLHLFLQHTSCALSMNENWDEEVRADMSDALDGIVKEDKGEPINYSRTHGDVQLARNGKLVKVSVYCKDIAYAFLNHSGKRNLQTRCGRIGRHAGTHSRSHYHSLPCSRDESLIQ